MDNTEKELEELQDQMDDVVNRIGEIIISIARNNDDFICTTCLNTAHELYQILKDTAREEDCDNISEQFAHITGRNIDD